MNILDGYNAVETENADETENTPIEEGPSLALFYLLGNGSLLPYNIFLNSIDLLNKYCDSKKMGMSINRTYSFTFSITSIIFSLFQPKNPLPFFIIGFVILTSITIAYPILLVVGIGKSTLSILTKIFFYVIGFASSIAFSSARKLVFIFGHSSYSFLTGSYGCFAVVAVSLRISTKSAFLDDSQIVMSSLCYYFLSAVLLLVFYVYYLINLCSSRMKNRFKKVSGIEYAPFISRESINILFEKWPFYLAELTNTFITTSLFPGYLTYVKESPDIGDWTPVIVTSVFCIFNLVGESFAMRIDSQLRYLDLVIAFCRSISYPLFIPSIENIFHLGEPVWTFCWSILFGLSNGLVKTHVLLCAFREPSMELASTNSSGPESNESTENNINSVETGVSHGITNNIRNLIDFWMTFSTTTGSISGVFMSFAFRDR
ncbi:nucleoside transmembrane transporter activity protein [Tritrichomonas musculus]|uniref:Nucleoside transmembrane transporter activity protein n=1 Tax=Tritrichomonas musculus TaxID=1915356 RepID=A0ABR2JYB3_9EUKA